MIAKFQSKQIKKDVFAKDIGFTKVLLFFIVYRKIKIKLPFIIIILYELKLNFYSRPLY